MSKARGGARNGSGSGPGVVEVRTIAARYYGVRVVRRLVPKLKNVKGLTRANSKSDLFCVEVDGVNNNPDDALEHFKEIVSEAGLGRYFGAAPSKRPG